MIKLPDEIVNLNKRHDARYQELLKMAVEAVREADELRAEVQRLNATAQPVSDGLVTVPRSLTAENGAKAALLGEFSVQQNITCHECFGEGCDDCNGQGNWTNNVPVDWTTIKEIWAKGVEHFLAAAPGGQDD